MEPLLPINRALGSQHRQDLRGHDTGEVEHPIGQIELDGADILGGDQRFGGQSGPGQIVGRGHVRIGDIFEVLGVAGHAAKALESLRQYQQDQQRHHRIEAKTADPQVAQRLQTVFQGQERQHHHEREKGKEVTAEIAHLGRRLIRSDHRIGEWQGEEKNAGEWRSTTAFGCPPHQEQ